MLLSPQDVSYNQARLNHNWTLLAMTLTAGTHLGPYEIVALIGAGGMGDVYRARDPRLGRDVPRIRRSRRSPWL